MNPDDLEKWMRDVESQLASQKKQIDTLMDLMTKVNNVFQELQKLIP